MALVPAVTDVTAAVHCANADDDDPDLQKKNLILALDRLVEEPLLPRRPNPRINERDGILLAAQDAEEKHAGTATLRADSTLASLRRGGQESGHEHDESSS